MGITISRNIYLFKRKGYNQTESFTQLMILTRIWRAVTANITNLSFYKPNFPFYATITSFLCYKTSSPFYKIKLRILKLSGYHNINIYIF